MESVKKILKSILEDDELLQTVLANENNKKRPASEMTSPIRLKKFKIGSETRSLQEVTNGGPKDGACSNSGNKDPTPEGDEISDSLVSSFLPAPPRHHHHDNGNHHHHHHYLNRRHELWLMADLD